MLWVRISTWRGDSNEYPQHMSRAMRKHVLCHMRTTKAQISLRIRAASVAEQASLSLTWSGTLEDTFSHDKAHMFLWRIVENYPLIIIKYPRFLFSYFSLIVGPVYKI